MATTIQIKRGTGSAVPTGLADGELAINLDNGKLYFGSGSTSINSFRFENITAENYIVSSSVTNITTQTLSGSTAFGDSADDTHTFIGNITASGNISATGNISASGRITAAGFVGLGPLSSTGDITMGGSLIHDGDTNTKITFSNDDINLTVAGKTAIDLTYDGDGGGDTREITFNEGHADIDVRIEGDTDTNLFFTDAGTDKVGIGTNSPNSKLQIDGDLTATHITASGNISSSGALSVFGEVVHLEGEDPRLRLKAKGANHPGIEWHEDSTRKWVLYNDPDENDKLVFKNDSTELVKISQAGSTEFPSHITASGNISASGTIEGTIYGGLF